MLHMRHTDNLATGYPHVPKGWNNTFLNLFHLLIADYTVTLVHSSKLKKKVIIIGLPTLKFSDML